MEVKVGTILQFGGRYGEVIFISTYGDGEVFYTVKLDIKFKSLPKQIYHIPSTLTGLKIKEE